MKNTLRSGLAAVVALVYCTLTGVCQSIQPEIHFRLVRENLIVVSVQADGQGPFDFVLDTGNDITIIDSSLADKLGLARSGHMQQTSVAGRRMVDRSALGRLALGTAQTDNFPVVIEDLALMRQMDPHIQGVLSQDFLSHFNYLLSYPKRILLIESDTELRNSLEGSRVPLEPRHDLIRDKMIVTADAHALSHSTLRLVLDSGANTIVLVGDTSKRLQVLFKENRWEQTLTGNVAVHAGPIHLITLGTEQLHEIMAANSTQVALPSGDGLLPTSLFQSLYVNNRENFVVFNPRIGRNSPRHLNRKDGESAP